MLSKAANKDALHQKQLEKILHKAFPGVTIFANARRDSLFRNPLTGSFLEIDVWIPSLRLAFEFQDSYHYVSTWYFHNTLSSIQKKDIVKQSAVKHKGATLILIPCWWDATEESLFSTISYLRPDLIPETHYNPIPLNPPLEFFFSAKIPEIGELMLASFVNVYPSIMPDTTRATTNALEAGYPWWIGEKYDGIRCVWHPVKQALYSRNNVEIMLPQNVTNTLPISTFFDGEIWNGRGCYQDSARILSPFKNMSLQKFIAFDDPNPFTQSSPFESRYTNLLENIIPTHPMVTLAVRWECKNIGKLREGLQAIIDDLGEGVILRKPRSKYEHGRTLSLLKAKSSHGDAEALVLESSSQGCQVQLPNGTKFFVRQADIASYEQPEEGDVVTVDYEQFSRRDQPVDPKILRIRADMEWRDVLRDFTSGNSHLETESPRFTTKPFNYWASNEGKNSREFLEDFALSQNLDPLLPSTWYSISLKDIHDYQGAQVSFLRPGYAKVLIKMFPDIGLEESKFPTIPKNHWTNMDNRRAFFESFAKEHGFDPLISENWEMINAQHLREKKGSDGLLTYYQGSMKRALVHVYPQLNLDLRRNRKKIFFDEFAKDYGFDPLIASNWYSVTPEQIRSKKGSKPILEEHGGNFSRALQTVYPRIGLNLGLFNTMLRKRHFIHVHNRKAFFDTFAKENGFDPLVAENWYSVTGEKINRQKHYSFVIRYYRGSFRTAVMDLYPDIGLEANKFSVVGRSFWADFNNQRKFFDDFARINNFDPLLPSNWYKISPSNFKEVKRIDAILRYSGTFSNALLYAYPDIGLTSFGGKRKNK